MSGHADTRYSEANIHRVVDERDALLAENQRWKVSAEAAFTAQEELHAENQRYEKALERVKRNAESWHGPDPREKGGAYGQQSALDVIAGWCGEALAGDTE